MKTVDFPIARTDLDIHYQQYNRRDRVHPDPLSFLYAFADVRDREIAGIVASSLAYGRVAQIHRSLSVVFEKMGASPRRFIMDATRKSLMDEYSGFSHRFATAEHLVNLLLAVQHILIRYGTIRECFLSGKTGYADTVLPALTPFAAVFTDDPSRNPGHLIPRPERGSACKRLNLFLRWMVRKDDVDPGGWDEVLASRLIVPLDVHIHRVGLRLGFTQRKQADMRTALEITRAFRQIVPDDPLRYDFTLCRMGMDGMRLISNADSHQVRS